jgi:hypothetical protein
VAKLLAHPGLLLCARKNAEIPSRRLKDPRFGRKTLLEERKMPKRDFYLKKGGTDPSLLSKNQFLAGLHIMYIEITFGKGEIIDRRIPQNGSIYHGRAY